MFKLLHLSLLLFGAVFGTCARAESVLFLNPGSTQEAFWVSYSQFMQAAARDLGIDLRILYAQRQPELTLAQARLALQGLSARIIWCSSTNSTWRRKFYAWPTAAA